MKSGNKKKRIIVFIGFSFFGWNSILLIIYENQNRNIFTIQKFIKSKCVAAQVRMQGWAATLLLLKRIAISIKKVTIMFSIS
jgi:hypothetical protein